MARRYYSSVAVPTTLTGTVTNSATTFALAASVGFPSSYPFTLVVDQDTAYEEVVEVTAALGGGSFTVTRGVDGTTAQGHSAGAPVRHAWSARDLDEPNAHIAATTAHGISGSVVGTSDVQVLTNKTLTAPTVNGGTINTATVVQPTLTLKGEASPTPTAEGDIRWDTDDNKIKVGDSAGTKTFSDDTVAAAALAAHESDTSTHGVGTVAGLDEAQTFTNKTLTAPVINDPVIAGGSVNGLALTGLRGAITVYAGATAPAGFLLCDGSAVSRSTYADLFTLIGTTYGAGNGTTTFNLPDLRGRVPVGMDNMGGSDAGRLSSANTLGTAGGAETHTLSAAETPSHTHPFSATTSTDGDHTHSTKGEDGDGIAGSANTYHVSGSGAQTVASAGSHSHTVSGTTGSAGSGGAHNNMQPFITLNYIIKF